MGDIFLDNCKNKSINLINNNDKLLEIQKKVC